MPMVRIATKASTRKCLKNWMRPSPYVMNDELRHRRTESRLFQDWPRGARGTGRLSAEEEVLLFKQLHYCGYRLSKLYKATDRDGPTTSIKRRYGEWGRRYHMVRARLVEANVGLVYDLIGHSRFDNLDHEEMSSDGMMALLRAVDTFDPWRGFRFSTYACNAILRAFARAAMQDSRRRARISGSYHENFEKCDIPERVRQDQQALFADRLRRILHMDNAELTDVQKTVLARRFPLEEGRTRQTLEEIGRMMRVSKERVRQIQLAAIAKLHGALIRDEVLQ
ncbi:MAG TPA: sigma-70 family RNA polymerase sigma factor [Phycisphaerae bacterium]|nr:sigma-70 family RNA polymerase sigma factor [Phycisphaerae bacterium]